MRLHRFDTTAIPPTPWKNGGGSTREIACSPSGSSLDTFDWRVSLATIASDGPFSRFPGIDRVLVLLSGSGLHLRSATGAAETVDERLTTASPPLGFAGETPLHGTMIGGPSTDFNVMTRRTRISAQVQVITRDHVFSAAPQGLLLAVTGLWTLTQGGNRWLCSAGTGLHWEATEAIAGDAAAPPWRVTPPSTRAKLLLVQFNGFTACTDLHFDNE